MVIKMSFKLNDNLIIREEEKTIFDIKDRKIYRLNDDAYIILKKIIENNGEKRFILRDLKNLDEKTYEDFIRELLIKNILIESK